MKVVTSEKLLGRWRITGSEMWARDALDLVGPAHFTFSDGGLGHFRMIAIEGSIDCRFEGDRVEFSWLGEDDGDPKGGRGWAELGEDGVLRGRLYIHEGDESGFTAQTDDAPPEPVRLPPVGFRKGRRR